MQVIIDRFEGDFAIVETQDKVYVNLPRILLPKAKEGDVINIDIDAAETEKRKKVIGSLAKEVWS